MNIKLLILLVCIFLMSCDDPVELTSPSSTSTTDIFSSSTLEEPFAEAPNKLCDKLVTSSPTNRLEEDSVIEISGVSTGGGRIWFHNDSGSEPGVYSSNYDGSDIKFYKLNLDDILSTDFEDIAIANNNIYLADIGNNGSIESKEVKIYKFPIPDSEIFDYEVFELKYPDGPRDAEALIVDPISEEFVIIDKNYGLEILLEQFEDATIYTGQGVGSETLKKAGNINLNNLAAIAKSELPESSKAKRVSGVVTAADISADGLVIALRTYRSVWLFPRFPSQTVSEAFLNRPCEAPVNTEFQGESVAFSEDQSGIITISEGQSPYINVIRKN